MTKNNDTKTLEERCPEFIKINNNDHCNNGDRCPYRSEYRANTVPSKLVYDCKYYEREKK